MHPCAFSAAVDVLAMNQDENRLFGGSRQIQHLYEKGPLLPHAEYDEDVEETSTEH
jgi:hypothetical protein